MSTMTRDVKLTYDDLLRLPHDDLRHELIDGVHYVTPSPVSRHQILLGRLFLAIGNWLELHPECGQVFLSPLDTVFSPWDVVEPDLIFVAADQLDILTEPNIQGAPALVVEILSPGTRRRDLGIKRALFDRGGVREYWVVDPEVDVIRVYRRSGDRFGRAVELSAEAGEVLTTPLLPGLEIPLADVFAA